MPLSDDIKSLAHDVGFHAVGITTAEPFVESERALKERYDRGLLEGSGYDPEVIRLYTHPKETLATARSIISVAMSYLSDESDRSDRSDTPRGWLARFSRGLDYHQVLQERMFVLAGDIRAKVGGHVEIRSFADTWPIADRSAAIRSGLGSRGKNTCVYAGEYASWVVLGELVTDLELDPDPPAPLDICGECDECMKACPTGAICEPYTVDVKICLSHVTQSPGFIPHPLREKLGMRIYGCDTCQSACPLNKEARPGNIDDFRPYKGLGAYPELLPLVDITPEEFEARVKPTTAGWIRRTRFRRNAIIALGNIRDPVAIPELIQALSDPEPVIRGNAAWALGKIGGSRPALESALARETDPQAADEIR
ncbi:MAG TPA: tRNA epoxyqueuosine(34) reductase QueG, partial [Armatimonadota bacterium]|nr:tRNA epoxyqueuosine(34) reductase QueG [Armatimonadota bacterium]